MNSNCDLIEDYYNRREWMLKIKQSYYDSNAFILFTKYLYNVIRLKNQMKKYFILRGRNNNDKAMDIIETELDYCYVSLDSMITNNYMIELSVAKGKKDKAVVKQKINEVFYKMTKGV